MRHLAASFYWSIVIRRAAASRRFRDTDLRTHAKTFLALIEAVHMYDAKAEGGGARTIPAIRRDKSDFIGIGPKRGAGKSISFGAWLVDARGVYRQNTVERGAEFAEVTAAASIAGDPLDKMPVRAPAFFKAARQDMASG